MAQRLTGQTSGIRLYAGEEAVTNKETVAPTGPTDFENHRRPDGEAAPGEQRSKRTSEERNDPEVEPGAAEGQPRHHSP